MAVEKKRLTRNAIIPADILDWTLARYYKVMTPVFDQEMGTRFKIARIGLNISQKKMADLLGQSQAAISRLETGKLPLVGVTAEQFKSVLGGKFDYVVLNSMNWKHESLSYQYNKRLKANVITRTVPKKV